MFASVNRVSCIYKMGYFSSLLPTIKLPPTVACSVEEIRNNSKRDTFTSIQSIKNQSWRADQKWGKGVREAHKVPYDSSTCSRQQTQPLPTKGHRCNSRKITQCKAKFVAEQLINDTLWKAVLAAASTRHPLPPAEPSDCFQCHKNKECWRCKARLRRTRSGGIFQSQLSHIFCFLSQT